MIHLKQSRGSKAFGTSPDTVAILLERTSPVLLARNVTLNLLTEGILFIVLVVATPSLVGHLGLQAFGLYALGWTVIGYLTYLELGVSRSVTQFVSKYLSQENQLGVRQAATTAIASNLFIGLVCGIVVVLLTPLLAHTVFQVPVELQGQARLVFYSVALAVPVVMLQAVFRAIAASYQVFGVINIVNVAGTTLQYAVACYLAWKGHGVGAVVFSTVVIRIGFAASYGVLVLGLVPRLLHPSGFVISELRTLLSFGGWITASQLILQMLSYLDRIFLATFVSLSAVTLFAVPFEGITRLRVIPSSLMATVYPAMTETNLRQDKGNLQTLYANSIRYLLFLMLPLTCFLFVFGKNVLTLWMGAAFAVKSAIVFQILAIGLLLNALAHVSSYAIQVVERPDLIGKYHLAILPVYVGFSAYLVFHWGIVGAATAASLRFALDSLVVFWMAQRYCGCTFEFLYSASTVRIVLLGFLLAIVLIAARWTLANPWLSLSAGILAIVSYFCFVWQFLLTSREKPAILGALHPARRLKII